MKTILLFLSIMMLAACNSNPKRPPINLKRESIQKEIVVPFSERNGIKTISVKLNGVPMEMIYDSGCSGVHISLLELKTLCKNGAFSEDDIIGISSSQIADGSIVENALVNIREIEIGGKDGIPVYNVQATVSLNQDAPILLGNGVLDKVASMEVDNINKVIRFRLN